MTPMLPDNGSILVNGGSMVGEYTIFQPRPDRHAYPLPISGVSYRRVYTKYSCTLVTELIDKIIKFTWNKFGSDKSK